MAAKINISKVREMQREIQTFGSRWEDIKASFEDSITFKCCGPTMVAMSYMSDAQETLAYGNVEQANQMINVAKRILADYVMEKRA